MSSLLALSDEPSKKEANAIARSIPNIVRRAERLKKEAEELKLLIMPRKQTAKLGDIPASIHSSGAVLSQTNPISKLPLELISMVIVKLSVPEQACLALSCKAMAANVEQVKISAAAGRRKKRAVTKAQRLKVLVAIRDWMPDRYKLCCICVVYKVRGDAGWRGNTQIPWRHAKPQQIEVEGPRCPGCAKRADLDTMQHKNEWRQLSKSIQAIGK